MSKCIAAPTPPHNTFCDVGPRQISQQKVVFVEIAICTFRRESVFRTLESVASLVVPDHVALSVIIADNDHHPHLEGRLKAAARQMGIDLRYIHAPSCNISIARNTCMSAARGDVLILIDDDEIADPDWLINLLAVAEAEAAGVVFGPARAIYPNGSPSWMRRNDFHSNIPVSNNGIVETGYCSNALLDLRVPQIREARFNEAFGRTGGEDTDFFFRLHRAGVTMAISDRAVVREPVEHARLSFRWLLYRRYSAGRIYGHCATSESSAVARFRLVVLSLLKSVLCGLGALAFAFVPRRGIYWIMRGSFHFGVAAGTICAPSREIYGTD